MTVRGPGFSPVIVKEQLPAESAHVVEMNETEPVPLWDQLTLPVGACPDTVTLQATSVDEAAGTLDGVQETMVFDGSLVAATVAGAEVTDAEALSVTRSSKLQVPAVVKAPVGIDGLEEGVQPDLKELPKATKLAANGDFSSHWQV